MKVFFTLLAIHLIPMGSAEEHNNGQAIWRNFFEHAVNLQAGEPKATGKGKLEKSLESFLKGPTPIAEGDVRLNSKGVAVMAHDRESVDEPNRPTFRQWFKATLASKIKIDSKK